MNPESQIPVTTAAIIVVIILAKFKRLIRNFRNSGATSLRTAKTLEELKIRPDGIFRRLLKRGVINEAGSNRYYLNEINLDEYNQSRRIRVMIILGVLIILFLMGIFFFKPL